ncbi:MAG: retropepsin-like aspartic protease family protein [Methylococcaceae bacterium]
MPKTIEQLLLASVLSTLSISASGDGMVYKCKNPQGDLIYQKSPCNGTVQAVSSWTAKAKQSGHVSEKKLVIEQSNNGHYFIEGAVNDTNLTFVIDTGASVISLPSSVAQAAEINCKEQVTMSTANGLTNGCTAIIPKLKFGPFAIEDVTAVIVPNLKDPLLGMNVLQQFNMVQHDGELRISEH